MTDPTPATGHEVAPPLTVITAPTGVTAAQVRVLLRTLAEVRDALRASAESGRTPRTWAWLGELAVDAGLTENEAVVEHDHVGRLAVRLAVDKTLCVGDSRSVRALTQGAVMEGSWGDEVRLVESTEEARELVRDDPDWRPGAADVILVAADRTDLAGLLGGVAAELGLAVRSYDRTDEHAGPTPTKGDEQ